MAERSEKAQERVREVLQRNPEAGTRELQEAAESVEPSVGELSLRQFNAGYVLPLKRKGLGVRQKAKSPAGGGSRRRQPRRKQAEAPAPKPRQQKEEPRTSTATAAEGERDRIRAALLDFARDFSEARSRSEIVGVLSDVDRYVERIVQARS